MLFLEAFFVISAQCHDVAHVDFVEGRELGGGVLRFLQAQRDGAAQAGHRHALLAIRIRARTGRNMHRRGLHVARRGACFERRQHVALRYAAVAA